jgi:hypothetical protein
MKTNKDIGYSLKNKLDGFKDSPDDIVWSRIDKKLKKRKRKVLFWYFSAGIASLFILLLTLHSFENKSNKELKPAFQSKPALKNELKNKDLIKIKNNLNKNEKKSEKLNSIPELAKNKKNPNDSLHKAHVIKSRVTLIEQGQTLKTTTSGKHETHQNKLKNRTNNSNQNIDNYNRSTHDKTKVSNFSNIEKKSISNTKIDTLKNDELEKLNLQVIVDSILVDETKELILEEKEETIKDSIEERQKKWSINPQYIISKYGDFKAETNSDVTTNYGILLGLRLKNKAYLRFGIKKLSLNNHLDGEENKVDYLEIPIEVKYLFRNKKLNPFATAGVSYFKLQSNNDNENNIEYTKFTISTNFGIGLEYKLFESFYINIESNFNYQIKPISNDIGYKPYILSISTGIEYQF